MVKNSAVLFSVLVLIGSVVQAQRLEIPRRHDRPPGPPLSAEDAVQKMVVPEGFSVEIVAKEPDVVNPVGMQIDEKGRFWITESFEYPRKSPGPGRDRIKVLEDTDGDGAVDKTTVFAEGLNIPSGIAVGYGGVWVANSPDLLFMQDTDGDLKADKIETVVTGFGRTDTHELPNSLTWGPDGWLYGLNGVFNYSDVKYHESNPNYDPKHPGWKFTCALFRIHPRTREFQLFSEGTSNPWGVAINGDGEFFLSACVIDHLWHLSETAYYIRQGGPYPPHTWPLRSIVDHKHQKAAFCGITWFDSEAYPPEYRNVLYMGNIHGGCLNADIATPSGSSYKGSPHPGFPAPDGAFQEETVRKRERDGKDHLADFLTANDAWFMPVVQKVGPDGCLYVLDWYDRYHCYQDANADPAGIEREKGRLYRIVYQGHKNRKADDLSQKSDDELISLLDHHNIYARNTAQRLLSERQNDETAKKLTALVLKPTHLDRQRRHALFALSGFDLNHEYDDDRAENLAHELSKHKDPFARAWALRLYSSQMLDRVLESDPHELAASDLIATALEDDDPRVRLQAAVLTTRMLEQSEPYVNFSQHLIPAIGQVGDDTVLLNVLWNTCLAWDEAVENGSGGLLVDIAKDKATASNWKAIPLTLRLVNLTLSHRNFKDTAAALGHLNLENDANERIAEHTILTLSRMIQNGEIRGDKVDAVRIAFAPLFDRFRERETLRGNLVLLQAMLGDKTAMASVAATFANEKLSQPVRLNALKTLVAAKAPGVVETLDAAVSGTSAPKAFRVSVLEALGGVSDPELGDFLLKNFFAWEQDVKPKVIEVMTQRASWSTTLLKAIEAEKLNKGWVNLNQLKRVSTFKDEELQKTLAKVYGSIRADRRSDRQHVIDHHRRLLSQKQGDPFKGVAVFKKVCAQCHKMYGDGAEVGPDITRNGRNNWNQLLQNVFDPSAVIGPGYQARTLATVEGRVLTGLPVEESKERVVLKIQGGKLETIPRDQIEKYKVNDISMMPEQLEKQLTEQELIDLFAYLALDKPPKDKTAKILPGAPAQGK